MSGMRSESFYQTAEKMSDYERSKIVNKKASLFALLLFFFERLSVLINRVV